MDKDDKKLTEIRKLLDEAEEHISAAKRILFEQVYQEQAKNIVNSSDTDSLVVSGVFDGLDMIDKLGKKYPVPANYSSKSKLVPGDKLKLTISNDGIFVYKQIGPIDRKRIIGKLINREDGWQVLCGDKKYNVLSAAVSYFKGKENDKITIILPKTGETEWAAIENLVEKGKNNE